MRSALTLLLMLSLLVPSLALDPRTIAPGVGIGHTLLHSSADNLTQRLGKPHDADSASGRTWATWYGKGLNGKHTELNIYCERDLEGLHTFVKQVRVTSPYFRTASGVGAGSTQAQVKAAFPAVRVVTKDALASRMFYDDKVAGIAFEFRRQNGAPVGPCVSVLVHPRGRAAGFEYGPFPGTY